MLDPAAVAVALQPMDSSNLGVGAPVAFEVEHELENLFGRRADENASLANDHRGTSVPTPAALLALLVQRPWASAEPQQLSRETSPSLSGR